MQQNDAEACRWYRMAADKGDATAMNNLGVMYKKGRGVQQNDVEACRWYRMAADKGDATAMNNLSWMYENGLGVKKDLSMAINLLTKATEADSENFEKRASFYRRQDNYDMAMLDWYKYYNEHEPCEITLDEHDWTDYINQHFFDYSYPKIKLTGEKYLFRSPCYIVYNYQKSKSAYEGTSYTHMSGTYSSGYFILTDRSIYIFNSLQLTKNYPAVKKNNLILMILGRTSFHFKPIDSDSIVHIPYNTIQSYSIDAEGGININAGVHPLIFGYYDDTESCVMAAIHQAQLGGFVNHEPEVTESAGIEKFIKLKDLLEAGVLTQTEYDERKNKILSEMGL